MKKYVVDELVVRDLFAEVKKYALRLLGSVGFVGIFPVGKLMPDPNIAIWHAVEVCRGGCAVAGQVVRREG